MKISLPYLQTSRASNSSILRIKKATFSGYCFYMNTNILGDFQICISVPLKLSILPISNHCATFTVAKNLLQNLIRRNILCNSNLNSNCTNGFWEALFLLDIYFPLLYKIFRTFVICYFFWGSHCFLISINWSCFSLVYYDQEMYYFRGVTIHPYNRNHKQNSNNPSSASIFNFTLISL